MKELLMQEVTINTNKEWYALYVNSRAEKKVMEVLLNKGIECYVPIVKTMKQWSDRKKMIEVPLISGYVFTKMCLVEKEKIIQTKGVVGFVKYCGEIAIVKERDINRLKQLVQLGYAIDVANIQQKHKGGDKVKIISGVLKNMEGYILDTKEGKYIEIVLESIGQSIKVKLPEEFVILI